MVRALPLDWHDADAIIHTLFVVIFSLDDLHVRQGSHDDGEQKA